MDRDLRMESEIRVGMLERERRRRAVIGNMKAPKYVELSGIDIGGIRVMRNQVLAEVYGYRDSRYLETADGVIDIAYNPNVHVPIEVGIIGLPGSFGLDLVGDDRVDMELDSGMEVEVGDRVLARYLGITSALGLGDAKGENRSFTDGEGRYFVILNYRDLFMRIRGDEFYMLNGWVLMETEALATGGSGLHYVKNNSVSYGRVVCLGSRVREYRHEYPPDLGQLEVGDYVSYTTGGDIPVRYGGVDYLRCPVRHIVSKFEIGGRPLTSSEAVRILSEKNERVR